MFGLIVLVVLLLDQKVLGPKHLGQCEQIGRFLKVLGDKCSPNVW